MSKVTMTEEQNANQAMLFRMTAAQYNIVKQLVRIQLAELIDDDANNKMIDFFTQLDASLSGQYEDNVKYGDDLPF